MVAGGHGHLGIKGHHMTTATDQFFRCAEEVGVQMDRQTQHLCLQAFA